MAEWFGEAPSNKLACGMTAAKDHCATFHADDEAYFSQIWYWSTPIAQCLDGRTERHVQGLRGLDPGLDDDQGLILDDRPHRGTASRRLVAGVREVAAPGRVVAAPPRRGAVLALLSAPMAWLVLAYLGSLAVLLVSSLWTVNSFTGELVRVPTLDELPRPSSPSPSTATSRCAASGSR